MRKVLTWVFVVLLPFVMLPQSKAQHQRELSQIRSRLSTVKNQISSLRKQEKGLAREIDLLEEQVSLTRRLAGELRASQRVTQRAIDSLEQDIDSLSSRLAHSKDNLRSRLVSLYKRGQFYQLELIFGASTVAEIYDRIYFTRYAARAEERLFEELLAAKHQLQKSEDSLAAFSSELSSLLREQKAAQDSLASARRSKKNRLSQIQSSKKSKEQLKAELEARQRKLERLIAQMEREGAPERRPTGTVIEKGRGNLPWPVGSRKVIATYGTIVHPRYKTKTFNDGIDIDCSGGKTVRAIHNGTVRLAGDFTGFGLVVIVDHQDGYYSIYSNLDRVNTSKGSKVSQGNTLGYASDFLHFSISKGSQFRNPIDYLK